jgi:hypothetical protein
VLLGDKQALVFAAGIKARHETFDEKTGCRRSPTN